MTITESIEYDVQCLDNYFRKPFTMAQEASLQECSTVATSEERSDYFIAHSVTAFIRPDMVCNVYSLVDFWLPKLCRFHECKGKPAFLHKKTKGESDLAMYHKHLTEISALSLHGAQSSYNHLDNLRQIRNCDIHSGGHIKDEQQSINFKKISGITVSGSLVIITDSFVWDSLKHAKAYLCAVAQA